MLYQMSRPHYLLGGKMITHFLSQSRVSALSHSYHSMSIPRILTVGTGAVGGLYSWRLSKSSHITAVCRSNYEIVKEKGFQIESAKFGKETFRPNQVIRHISESDGTPYDYIVITLKALPEVYNVADIIAPAVSKNTTIVIIQNGLGVEEPITTRFPHNPIVSIVAYIGTSQTEPGKILMVGRESLIVGKYLDSKVNSDKQQAEFIDLLKKGNVDVQEVDDVERVRWQKLFWNAAFSPVCAITGMNTSELLRNEKAMTTVKSVMSEVIHAANAAGYKFNEKEQINHMIEKTEATALNYKPSMQLDKERGSPMEIEVILGTPLRRAKAKGLTVPSLELMYYLCSAMNSHIMNKANL